MALLKSSTWLGRSDWTVVLWSPRSYDMIKPTESLPIETVFVSFKVSTVFQHSFPLPFTREHINPYSKACDLLLHFCWFSTISCAAAWGLCQFTNLHSETCAVFQGSAPNAEALLGLNYLWWTILLFTSSFPAVMPHFQFLPPSTYLSDSK